MNENRLRKRPHLSILLKNKKKKELTPCSSKINQKNEKDSVLDKRGTYILDKECGKWKGPG